TIAGGGASHGGRARAPRGRKPPRGSRGFRGVRAGGGREGASPGWGRRGPIGGKRPIAPGGGQYWWRRPRPYLNKSQTHPFMTAVALRRKFFKGCVEFGAIFNPDSVAKLLRRHGASVCLGHIRKEGSRILQGCVHLRQLIFGQRPVSEVACQPQ